MELNYLHLKENIKDIFHKYTGDVHRDNILGVDKAEEVLIQPF